MIQKREILQKTKKVKRKGQNCDLELQVRVLKTDQEVVLDVFLYVNQRITFLSG